MNSEITIGDYIFRVCHSFSVRRSWKTITQIATIKLPNFEGLIDKIKVGDEVEIKGGYDGEYNREFVGHVSEIMPTIPVEIKCECKMWKLKQETISMSWQSTTLRDVLKFLVPGATIECPEVTLSPFRLDKVTKAKALQKLKDEYLLTVYYRFEKLFVGLPYTEKDLPTKNYLFRTEGANANIDGLIFKNAADVKIKVKAISMFPNNKKIVKEYGDNDGNSTTLHYYNKSESEMDALVKEQMDRMKYDGYRGTFKTKGMPFIDHGHIAHLLDAKYPEKEQSVFVDSVAVEYGPSGYNRIVEAGKKILAV